MLGRSHSKKNKNSDGDKLPKHRFAMSSLRGLTQPELSKKLYTLIKNSNHAISAHEHASKEGQSVANQISEWGESTDDEAISDISDKLGVLLAEIAEQDDLYAQNLEESRGLLKQIRNTESSVQPTRNHKSKIQDEIQKLKVKEPESTKLPGLEQELVRAEAQSLVAEAQLTNVTRQKFKEAFDVQTAGIIERAEKQIILAQHARRLLSLLDDSPIVPGEERPDYVQEDAAREVLNNAEQRLKSWNSDVEPLESSLNKVGDNALGAAPAESGVAAEPVVVAHPATAETITPATVSVEDSTAPTAQVTGNAALAS